MTAKEIRDLAKTLDDAAKGKALEGLSMKDKGEAILILTGSLAFAMICEVAAQLAEINEKLEKINELPRPE